MKKYKKKVKKQTENVVVVESSEQASSTASSYMIDRVYDAIQEYAKRHGDAVGLNINYLAGEAALGCVRLEDKTTIHWVGGWVADENGMQWSESWVCEPVPTDHLSSSPKT